MLITKDELIEKVQQLCNQYGYYYSQSTGAIRYKGVPNTDDEEILYSCIYDVLKVAKRDINGKLRTREICDARFMLYAFLKELYPMYTLKQLGKRAGNRDHSSIINGQRQHEGQMKFNAVYRAKYEAVREELTHRGVLPLTCQFGSQLNDNYTQSDN